MFYSIRNVSSRKTQWYKLRPSSYGRHIREFQVITQTHFMYIVSDWSLKCSVLFSKLIRSEGSLKPCQVHWLMLKKFSQVWWHVSCLDVTLDVGGPSYLGLTRSRSWLLMPWLLTSPGHKQPWYWLCRICRFLSYLRKDFNYLCRINVKKWHKM